MSGLLDQRRCNFARLLNQFGKLLNFQRLCRLQFDKKLEGGLDILTTSQLLKNAIKIALSFLDFVDLALQAMDSVSQINLFLVELLQFSAESPCVRLQALGSLLEGGDLLLDFRELVSLSDVPCLDRVSCILERLQVVR